MNVFIDARFDAVYERRPLTLADVGARGGLKSNWHAARRHLRLIGFEPDPIELNRLLERAKADGSRNVYLGTALHHGRGTLHLHVARDPGLTSIFPPNRSFLDAFPDAGRFDTVAEREIEGDALDEVLHRHAIADVDFIKADTQGSELLVLQGARNTLTSSVFGVEAEVEFAPVYAGQPLFADVDAYLRGLGFLLFDLRPCYWKRELGRAIGGPRGQIIWADALYLKDIHALEAALADRPPEERLPKVLKAISVSLLYGYYDYAIEVATALRDQFTAADWQCVVEALRDAGGKAAQPPRFPGRRLVVSALHRLWKLLRERSEGWSVSEAEIGNLR